MSRPCRFFFPSSKGRFGRLAAITLVGAFGVGASVIGGTADAGAATVDASPLAATTANWCTDHGATIVGWTKTSINLPICGPGPDYGGSWDYIDLPGPGGLLSGYFNATPGFQCVELAERFLAVTYGFGPIEAEGSTVAANYHALYPRTELVVNGTPGGVRHAPVAGDVISFSLVPSFDDPSDGHVAVVVRSSVDPSTGDGTVLIAQENVASGGYVRDLDLVDWRLEDPTEPADAEWQFPYAEWLHVQPISQTIGVLSPLVRHIRPSVTTRLLLGSPKSRRSAGVAA